MSRPGLRGSAQLRSALAAVLAGAVVFVLPLTGSATASELAALSLVMLALASALACAPQLVTALSV